MKLRVDGAILYLGRRRRDGFHNVERVRLTTWYPILRALKKAKPKHQVDGNRLFVLPEDPRQLMLAFMEG